MQKIKHDITTLSVKKKQKKCCLPSVSYYIVNNSEILFSGKSSGFPIETSLNATYRVFHLQIRKTDACKLIKLCKSNLQESIIKTQNNTPTPESENIYK